MSLTVHASGPAPVHLLPPWGEGPLPAEAPGRGIGCNGLVSVPLVVRWKSSLQIIFAPNWFVLVQS